MVAETAKPTRPATGVHAKPVPENASVTVWGPSLTWVVQRSGKKRPMALPFGASLSGAPRFSISGHMRCAPKFENRNQRSSGLALTEPRNRPQPLTPSSDSNAKQATNAARLVPARDDL